MRSALRAVLRPRPAGVRIDDLPNEVHPEAETITTRIATLRGEGLETRGRIGIRKAGTAVSHIKQHFVVSDLHVHRFDAATVTDGVVDDVGNGTMQQRGIRSNDVSR